MTSTTTLTSLAMLKVSIDQGKDYLRPFILQVLVDQKPDPVTDTPVTDTVVRDHLRVQIGLEIPDRAVQVVLKRLSRKHPLKKQKGIYRITGQLPDPGIVADKASADRHIKAVVTRPNGLLQEHSATYHDE